MKKKLLLYVLTLLIGFSWGSYALAGFGISPPYVQNDHLIPGSSYEQEINLLRSSSEDDLQANLEIDAPEIASWITIDKGTSFIIPKGQLRAPIMVKINVPKGADVGGYQGHINIKVSSASVSGSGVSVALGARVDINLTLTNETFPDFLIRMVKMPDIEQLGWPWNTPILRWFFYRIKATIKIENTGNVKISPSKVHLDVYDLTEKNLLESNSDTWLSKIEPYSSKEITASFPTKLSVGQYWGKIKIYKGDQVVNSYKMAFTIAPKGSLGNNGLGRWPIILLTAAIVLLLLIIYTFIKLRGWRLFIFLSIVIFKLAMKILGPLGRLAYKAFKSVKLKIFEWILQKAKEHEKDKK